MNAGYTSDLPGTNYFSNLTEWALPAEDWLAQPPIQLSGKAALARHITISQNGQGNGARELRVAGWNENGKTGYWTKAIFDDAWDFVTVPLFFGKDAALNGSAERGTTADKPYRGRLWNGTAKTRAVETPPPEGATKYDWIQNYDWTEEKEWFYGIPNFNILWMVAVNFVLCGAARPVRWLCNMVEMWSYLKRDYMPGRTGAPKIFLATVEIPEAALADLSPEFSYEILKRFTALDKKIFHYTLAAAPHFILMRDSENINSVFYFTDGCVSERYGDFQQRWFVEDYAEASRINAPELIIDENAPVTDDELSQKIAANKVFRKELKYIIRQSNWSNLTAFKFNFYYIPTHYSIKMSPLRFIDVPKIRTITTYGDRIVLSNSAFITTIAELRVELDRLLLDSVNRRIKHYTELQTASRLSGGTTRTRDSKARPRVYRGHAHHCQQVKGIDIIKKA